MIKRSLCPKLILTVLICLTASNCAYFQTTPENSNQSPADENAKSTNSRSNTSTSEQEVSEKSGVPDGIYIIFDASGSMWGQLKNKSRKIDVARKVLIDFVGGDFSGYDLAFRAYGHRRKDDCTDSELVVPFGDSSGTIQPMRDFVGKISPLGMTPITYSLEQALKDFADRSGEIILISDGIESCDADPCALIREWRSRNVKVKVHVVGFGLDEKSKGTLKCISEAAGTDYHDAQSAESLADALKKIRDKATSQGFVLKGVDPSGKNVRVRGTLSRDSKVAYNVSSNGRYRVDSGEYELNAGVETINGNLYKTVTKSVKVSETGESIVEVKVPLPPRVKAKFRDSQDEEQRGSLVTVWQNGKQVGKFRAIDEVFIDEGIYEFRTSIKASGEVSVKESFSAGDRKEILFELARTVRILIRLKASGSSEILGGNPELWQGGKMVYEINRASGKVIKPGTYNVRSADPLLPFEQKNVVVSNEAKQEIEITVPVGFVTFVYQKRDGSADKPDRVFVRRQGSRQRAYRKSGVPVFLTPGRYAVEGWTQKGTYEIVSFSVSEGDKKQVVLRAQ